MTLSDSFIVPSVILDMLIQSWGDKIRVFPAVPPGWKDAVFDNLRCSGAFLVSSELKDGDIKYVRIISEKGGTVRVLNPFKAVSAVIYSREDIRQFSNSEWIEFDTVPGGSYLVCPRKEDHRVNTPDQRQDPPADLSRMPWPGGPA
jgi:hypothetical protein